MTDSGKSIQNNLHDHSVGSTDIDVDDIIKWWTRKFNINSYNNNFVRNFLKKCNYDQNLCKEALARYICHKKVYSEYLQAGDLKHDSEFRDFCNSVFSLYMPTLTSERYRVYIDKITNDEHLFSVSKIMKYFSMQTDLRFMEDQSDNGDVFLFDCNHANLLHFMAFTPYFIKSLTLVLEVYPMKLKLLVLVNTGNVMALLLNTIKLLFLRKFASMFYVYSNGCENFQKHVEVDVLPSDYGGKLPKLELIRKNWIRILDANHQLFTEMNHQINSGCYEPDCTNIYGVNGSFTHLEID